MLIGSPRGITFENHVNLNVLALSQSSKSDFVKEFASTYSPCADLEGLGVRTPPSWKFQTYLPKIGLGHPPPGKKSGSAHVNVPYTNPLYKLTSIGRLALLFTGT